MKLSKRERGRRRSRLKRTLGLSRRELGAIGAGHMTATQAVMANVFRERGLSREAARAKATGVSSR